MRAIPAVVNCLEMGYLYFESDNRLARTARRFHKMHEDS